MARAPLFDLGDHITITPLDSIRARVVAIELACDGWSVVCRYFENGDAKTVKCFEDEVIRTRAA